MSRLDRVATSGLLRAIAPPNGAAKGGRAASLQAGIETYLAAYRGRIVSAAELIAWCYADDPDGGPLDAEKCVRVSVCRLRRRGVPIVTVWGRGYMLAAERVPGAPP